MEQPEQMTKEEAEAYLRWYNDKAAEYHYTAHFASSRPFAVDYPEAGAKRSQAKIVLGKHEYQRDYETLLRVYPHLSLEEYNEKRERLGIK